MKKEEQEECRQIFFEVLLDFLKELPKDFDANYTTYAQACDLINEFIKRHGLTDEDKN
jgi:hypothetical protein